eukprot:comp22719_c4_seq1/m.35302 comp22719_c4_seq1/g.35302  ORF comp22719_c4_seq1/g.35302 comp22719_c4_seq1/m.35302 type:complete len:1244 (-) comp22719_c4_seq1:60-3791(-)
MPEISQNVQQNVDPALVYETLDLIGDGSFGEVHKARPRSGGPLVAMKSVKIEDEEELKEFQIEIDILAACDHRNIVRLYNAYLWNSTLYMALEYCAGGAVDDIYNELETPLNERQIRIILNQVLRGLHYLHTHRVIHRDVKAGNVLLCDDGQVKLADFGVATQLQDQEEGAVVGTPYWMAPEIIELSGARYVSDIWSVGCTVIELLTGNPPYFDLAPMPALFRIVQDEHPPFPDSISPALKDFLLQTFAKDPNLRNSARKMLRHPFVRQNRKKAEGLSVALDDQVESIKEFNKTLNEKQGGSTGEGSVRPVGSRDALRQQRASPHSKHHHEGPSSPQGSPQMSPQMSPQSVRARQQAAATPSRLRESGMGRRGSLEAMEDGEVTVITTAATLRKQLFGDDQGPSQAASRRAVGQELDDDDDWDSAFANEGKPGGRGWEEGLEIEDEEDESDRVDDVDDWDDTEDVPTVRIPYRGGAVMMPKTPKTPKPPSPQPPIPKPTASPSPAPVPVPVPNVKLGGVDLSAYREEGEDNLDEFNLDEFETKAQVMGARLPGQTKAEESGGPLRPVDVLARYVEDEEESFDDFEGPSQDTEDIESILHRNKNRNNDDDTWDAEDDSDEEDDVFAELDQEEFEDYGDEERIANEQFAKTSAEVRQLIDQLRPSADTQLVEAACFRLIEIFKEEPAQRNALIAHNGDGVIKIMELLGANDKSDVQHYILKVVNQIVEDSDAMQENLSLIGGIPAMIKFVAPHYHRDIRMEAARFIRQICRTSPLTLQMFIACRGLPVLIQMLDPNYDAYKELVLCAVDCICNVMALQSSRNDFARIFAKGGLLERLATVLDHLLKDQSEDMSGYVERICDLFVQFSHADSVVKIELCEKNIARRLLDTAYSMRDDLMVKILKCVKNLTSEAAALELLQESSVIEAFVRMAEKARHYDEKHPNLKDIQYNVFNALYNLLKVNRERQERAAVAGLVPYLMDFDSKNVLRQFTLPILCDIGLCSRKTRDIIYNCNGLAFLFKLFEEDKNFQANVFDVFSVWLQDDPGRMEPVLTEPRVVHLMIDVFGGAKSPYFDLMQRPLEKMVYASERLNHSLGSSRMVTVIIEKFKHTSNSNVRLMLMKILTALYERCLDKAEMVKRYDLLRALEIVEGDSAIMVSEMGKQLSERIYNDCNIERPAPKTMDTMLAEGAKADQVEDTRHQRKPKEAQSRSNADSQTDTPVHEDGDQPLVLKSREVPDDEEIDWGD